MKYSSVMRYLSFVCTVLILIVSNNAFAMRSFTAEVISVIDGDSIKVRDGHKLYEVRLYGIDTPEYDQPYASKAKKLVKTTILGKNVLIIPVEWDRYHRLVAIVKYQDQSINRRLVSNGLAWYYPKYCKKKICKSWKKEGKKAKKRKRNIWSDPSSVAPWKWKYYKYKRK